MFEAVISASFSGLERSVLCLQIFSILVVTVKIVVSLFLMKEVILLAVAYKVQNSYQLRLRS